MVYLRTLSTLRAVAQAPRFPGWCSYLIAELWRTLWHSSLTIKAPWWKWVLATLPVASAGDPEAGVWAGLRSHDIGECSVLRKQFTSSAPNMQGMVLMGFPRLYENVSDTAHVPSTPHLKPSFSWGQRWQGVSRETLPCSLYDNNNSPHELSPHYVSGPELSALYTFSQQPLIWSLIYSFIQLFDKFSLNTSTYQSRPPLGICEQNQCDREAYGLIGKPENK